DRDDPVVAHVETIFTAGITEGRLDIAELLRHTEARLLAGDPARRYLLGVFIIIGLLGTLFGLADSMAALSGSVSDLGPRHGLLQVLKGLRSAFAPSIWGIFWSVISTLVFSVYHRSAVAPTIKLLREATLTQWVLHLYPTAGQRLIEATRRSLEAVEQ